MHAVADWRNMPRSGRGWRGIPVVRVERAANTASCRSWVVSGEPPSARRAEQAFGGTQQYGLDLAISASVSPSPKNNCAASRWSAGSAAKAWQMAGPRRGLAPAGSLCANGARALRRAHPVAQRAGGSQGPGAKGWSRKRRSRAGSRPASCTATSALLRLQGAAVRDAGKAPGQVSGSRSPADQRRAIRHTASVAGGVAVFCRHKDSRSSRQFSRAAFAPLDLIRFCSHHVLHLQ